jgi:hypothetical protein
MNENLHYKWEKLLYLKGHNITEISVGEWAIALEQELVEDAGITISLHSNW